MKYIKNFRHFTRLESVEEYYFTTISSAIEFIEKMQVDHLAHIDLKEFMSLCADQERKMVKKTALKSWEIFLIFFLLYIFCFIFLFFCYFFLKFLLKFSDQLLKIFRKPIRNFFTKFPLFIKYPRKRSYRVNRHKSKHKAKHRNSYQQKFTI